MIPIYAQRIREVRQSSRMTQTEFALKIGTTKNQLSKYELGTQETPLRIIRSICILFDIDANWLLGIDENIEDKYELLVVNTKSDSSEEGSYKVFKVKRRK